MSNLINYKTNFTAGAVSLDLLGRTDLSAYDNGALELKNVFISPIGGIERRAGLRYIDTIDNAYRLIAFAFNTAQTYLCVLGNAFIKVYKNENLIQTLSTPWQTDDIPHLRWTQSADTLLLTHPDYEPMMMTRQNDESFVLSNWVFDMGDDGQKYCPFEKYASAQSTMKAVGDGNNVVLTASEDVFNENYINRHIKVGKGEYKITEITDAKNAKASKIVLAENSNPTTNWSEEAFSKDHGYPVCVTFYQGRLVIGGSRDLPNKLWFSKSFAIMNFDTGTGLDDEAIGFSLLSDQVNAICGLMPGRHLQVFTSGSEWMVSGEPLTPQNIQLKRQTKIGSPLYRFVPPVDVSGATLFVSENGQEIREFLFADLEQAYQAKNVSLLSYHLINRPIDIDYDAKRRLVYVIMEDGSMASLTNYRSEEVLAWSSHETQGKFLSVCVLEEEVYFLINRDGKTYLEVFDNEVFTDCAFLGQSEEAHETWSGLSVLDGKKVNVVADGRLEESVVISSNSITLSQKAKQIQVGLAYTHTVVPLPPIKQIGVGNLPLKAVRLVEVNFKVIDTASLFLDVGNGYNEFIIQNVNDDYILDGDAKGKTKDVCIRALGWVRDGVSPLWKIQSTQPLSCKIVSVATLMKVSD
ncbi:MAG: hypothetical protein E7013_00830 [Alphaproteobacteria bacterium]|nr:hypothetical protein [Alphaproteobacteria bacterium]